ncbi:CSC1-like protein HYP1 isoform X1 [Cornus florida]|uniref:CSC1-like protein HYP1 isoform X1 n=1 Tax=Cornus florida TaxID=4283 RepID=UPI0028A1317E|nr:CSC1-like protein HYP1 isoform X1 [Cornus florida]XP_059670374.1 CSC1-like protein HYP1 isoform X1 [Cornus florida]XP_059670375.1 CSC1-like protein HYP1 isoform X1 [Cornus florida]XP_059670376.1 CSC1-like protein HYP1 isoform X1 [Cornus florida]
MILSALLTSVGINLGLCLLFCTLYSILRKQPGNISVYAPRLIAERNAQERTDFNLERLLPSPGWVREAWRPSEAELLSISGLDAVVFMRIFTFGFKVFSFAGIIGVFILLPINYLGNQLSADFSDLANKSLDSFTISNVDNGSNWLWIHFSAAYVFTAIVCYLLYFEYNYISSKRIAYFYSSKPQPHQFTILVRSIPASSSSSFSESVESFFMENYPSTYLSNSVVRRTSKIQGLISDADKMYRKLAHLKSTTHTQQRFRRDGFLGLFGRKVNILDQYEKKLEDLEDNMRMEQTSIVGKEVPAAFVSFKSRFVAAIALHIQQGVNPIEWVTEPAPEPRDVYWPFFSASFIKRWIWKLVVFVAYILITVLFLIPVVLVQGLTNLEQLETWFPFLESILELTVVSQVITGYLPSLILQLFLSFVPPIMIMFSSLQGYIALSQIAKSACIKVLCFKIWNIFFANVLSGTALYQFNLLLEPKKIPSLLAEAVPAQASFFIAYVVTSGWTSTSSELFRLIPLICSFFKKASDEVPSISYHSEIPKILFFGLLGITYFLLSPLILPFLLVYYCLGFIIYRNQLLNVYAPKFETGGKFWPIVHNSTIFSLVLMHIIAIGIFGLKKLPVASSLIIPLPVLTLLFNDYCRKRYLPIFKEYPAECLIKKDRDDQNDPTISDFLDKLVTAYQDPALMPTQHSGSGDRRTSPLLHAAED